MRPAPVVLSADSSVRAALEQVGKSHLDALPIVRGKVFYGMLRLSDLMAAIESGREDAALSTILRNPPDANRDAEDFPHIHSDQLLHVALERMGSSGLNVLPVVSRANLQQLLGIVVLEDVLKAYGVAPEGI